MNRQHRRLSFAALLSASVFGLNLFWYKNTRNSEASHSNLKPIAYVGQTIDEIQRRPTAKLLWQLINSGDPLYDGEAIRTGPQGEVRIELAESNSFIDLEPESLIILKRGQGEISLDLLEGHLYIAAEKSENMLAATKVVLNSPQGKVHLSSAKATLSAKKDGNVEFQIHEGKALIQNKSGRMENIKTTSPIRIISPSPQKPIALNSGKPEPILFEWEGFAPDSTVTLFAGKSRKNLKEVARAKKGGKSLLAQLPLGRNYWKLVGHPTEGSPAIESATYKSDLIVRYPPTIVFPEPNSVIRATKDLSEINFRWANQQSNNKTHFLLSTDPDFKSLVISKTVEKSNSFLAEGLVAGVYYWKMVHYYHDFQKPIEGTSNKFTLLEPQNAPSKSLTEQVVKIHFESAKLQLNQVYPESLYFKLSWSAENEALVKKWRIHLFDESLGPETAETFELTEKKVEKQLRRPGRYIASVEALDQKGRILSSTQSPSIDVQAAPVLTSPQWTTGPFKKNIYDNEKVDFAWTPVEGAEKYTFVITSNNQQIKKITLTKNSVSFKNLQPGIYEAQVYAIDSYERSGVKGDIRKLEVTRKPDIRAPALKKIKVN